jgi:hypothetical protein
MNNRETGMSTADMVPATEPRDGDNRGNGAASEAGMRNGADMPLLEETESTRFRSRWDEIQRGFVDEPRKSVEKADALVAEAIQQLTKVFAQQRSMLEQQLSRGDEASTDDLRLGLQRYRSFFQRLLEVQDGAIGSSRMRT